MRDLATLPKAHLHLHLDGALREQTLQELCERRGTPAPQLPPGRVYSSFAVFMDVITACHDALASPDNLERVVGEVVEDAAADGAVWVELSLWPGLFQGRLGPDREAVQLVLHSGHAAAARLGVGFGLMVAANRHLGPDAASRTARLATVLATEGVVSFGLDGDEAAHPPAAFEEAFAIARHGGLLATPHAGESLGSDSVAVALEALGAHRILHGVRAVEDPTVVARLASAGVCLDVCPTSNVRLGVFAAEDHPLATLIERGVRCSVNADDPLLFGTSLLDEYALCRAQFSLSDHQLAQVAETSIDASGAPSALKGSALAAVERWRRSPV